MSRLRALVVTCAVSALVFGVASPAFANDVITVSAPDPSILVLGNSYQPTVTGGDGGPVLLSVSTPAVCTVVWDGATVTFDHAGSCTVDGSDYSGETGSVTFTIPKASQTIDFTAPTGGTIGDTETLTATSNSGLDVSFSSLTTDVCTVTGDQVSYDHAGTCTVAADQAGSDDYLAADQVTHDVVLPKLDQSIDFTGVPTDGQVGDTQTLSATSDSDLTVTFESTTTDVCSVDGDTVAFEHVGTCTVGAIQVGNDDYNAADEQYSSADVAKGDQTITFGQLQGGAVGTTETVSPTSDSPLPVSVTSTTTSVCSVTGDVVSYNHVGTCTLAAAQAGNNDYNAASTVTQSTTVTPADQVADTNDLDDATRQVGLTHQLGATSSQGQPVTWTASAGTTACTVSGTTLSFVHAGNCSIHAAAPATSDYTAVDKTFTVTVSKGASSVTVAPTSTSITATVQQASGSGAVVDGSTVTFTVGGTKVGSATVTKGVATLKYHVPTGAQRTIGATYAGSSDLTADTESYTRTDPKVTVASVKSSVAETKYGWYRKPVTTTFACTKGSGTVTSCSKPVTLSANGKHRAVTGKAAAADGGASSETTYVNIDTTAPKVSVSGPANGAVYVGSAPKATCVGTDALSGIATCALRVEPHANGVFTYAASAIDKAGNTSRVTGTYRVQNRYIRNAIFDGASNSYIVQAGTRVTLVALAPSRPQYLLPVHSTQRPHVAGHTFFHDGRQAGLPRWSLGVLLPKSMSGHTFWNLGIKVGDTVYNVKVRVTN